MSTIQLVDRSAGQVIQQNFYNDIHSALEGDFVGRDVNGRPVAGNNLGTPAYPWGKVYADDVVVGGIALSPASLESDAYQIVSGKKRSSSNQPAFLQAAGSAASFNLLAGTTNLVLQINGVAVTWTADKNSIPVSTAPGAQNTATVNDATAAGQAATRTWGEYGSGAPYYAITIGSVGTNITARVGTLQAFKVGTEYFLAVVESTTSLSRAFRGFFFDSSGNPVKRATFSNGATITLMNLGWVFVDQDGSTVDTIFVGSGVNNSPVASYSAPASPLNGDYWFDQGNRVWKRYNVSSWQITPRIPVGLVVADSSNCVAVRCFDFWGLVRNDNTIELAVDSNTAVKGAGLFSRVNVSGSRLSFPTRPTWDTASNLAASPDRYNATVQASTTEFFYVSDQGDTVISDIEPHWRPDLLGYYHPFNPWRAVGYTTTDGSANFQSSGTASYKTLRQKSISTDLIADAAVTPVKMAANTQASTNFGSTTTVSSATVGSLAFTASGLRPVLVCLTGNDAGTDVFAAFDSNAEAFATVQISDGTVVRRFRVGSVAGSALGVGVTITAPVSFFFVYFPAAGTRTYTVTLIDGGLGGSHNATLSNCNLTIMEL
jgi:hypothetical protein